MAYSPCGTPGFAAPEVLLAMLHGPTMFLPFAHRYLEGQQEARALETLQFMPKHIITAMPLSMPSSHTVPASSHPPAALAYGSYLDLLLACRTQEALPSLVQVCERNDC